MKHKVRIVETLSRVVEIESYNEKEALMSANSSYADCEDGFVLSYDDFTEVKFSIVKE